MGTNLGFTRHNYGQKFGIVSTHLSGPEILDDENLVPNSFIVSSPVLGGNSIEASDKLADQESHALFFTDYEGKAARLTYTIKPGNGLVVNAYTQVENEYNIRPYSTDTLSLEIDHDSLKTKIIKGQLYVSKPDIIDNYTLMVSQEINSPHTYISVVTENLEKATSSKFGITRGDNYTIFANNGILAVNTENLQYVDDDLNHCGIVRFNPDTDSNYNTRTVTATNGVLRVITQNLDRASDESVGVVKPDFITTSTNNQGIISVLTAGLDKASYLDGIMTYGIVRPDNYTMQLTDPGVLYANSENMTPTRFDENGDPHFGVIKLDPVSFGIDTSLCTYINRYGEIQELLNRYLIDYSYIMNWLIDHENRITALENQASAEYIYSFTNYGTTITTLDEPVWDPEAQVVHSEEKFYSVQFSINTNCKFHISVRYMNNVSKPITLHSVKLGDNAPISASSLSQYIFDSTNMNENTLNLTFLCDNYMSNSKEAKTHTTAIITVSSINDSSIYKEGAHIFDRWNMSKYIQPAPPEPVITEEIIYSYQYTYTGSPQLIIYSDNPNENNSSRTTGSSIYLYTSVQQTQKSSAYLNIEMVQPMSYTVYKETKKYRDGVYAPEISEGPNEIVGSTYGFYSYLSLPIYSPLDSHLVNSSYYLAYTVNYYSRSSEIDENIESSWNNVSNGNRGTTSVDPQENAEYNDKWLKMYVSSLASNTSRHNDASGVISSYSSNYKGYNVLNFMSTKPIHNSDRRAEINLYVVTPEQAVDLSTVTLAAPTINYIEDITSHPADINISSQCSNDTTSILSFNISKNGAQPINDTWTVYLQYIYTTATGNIVRNSSLEDITGSTMSIIEDRDTGGTNNDNSNQNISPENFSNNTKGGTRASADSSQVSGIAVGTINTDSNNNEENDESGEIMETTTFQRISITIPKEVNSVNLLFKLNNGSVESEYTTTPSANGQETPYSIDINYLSNSDNSLTSHNSEQNTQNIIPDSVVSILTDESSTNIISGLNIINAYISGFATIGNVSFNSTGNWSTNIAEPTTQMTFGNASITSIKVNPWDDTRLQLEFTINPGGETRIPTGSLIYMDSINGISPNCQLYNGNESRNYTYFYNNMIISNDGWTSTGCKINIALNNITPPVPAPGSTTTIQMVSSQSSSIAMLADGGDGNVVNNYNSNIGQTVQAPLYSNGTTTGTTSQSSNYNYYDIPASSNLVNTSGNEGSGISTSTGDGLSLSQHNQLNVNYPMLSSLSAIRFNFTLRAVHPSDNTKYTLMNFAASLSTFSDKVNFNNTLSFQSGGTKDLNPPMVNAFFSNGSTIQQEEMEDQMDPVTQITQDLEEIIRDTVNSMINNTSNTNTETSSGNTSGLGTTSHNSSASHNTSSTNNSL